MWLNNRHLLQCWILSVKCPNLGKWRIFVNLSGKQYNLSSQATVCTQCPADTLINVFNDFKKGLTAPQIWVNKCRPAQWFYLEWSLTHTLVYTGHTGEIKWNLVQLNLNQLSVWKWKTKKTTDVRFQMFFLYFSKIYLNTLWNKSTTK